MLTWAKCWLQANTTFWLQLSPEPSLLLYFPLTIILSQVAHAVPSAAICTEARLVPLPPLGMQNKLEPAYLADAVSWTPVGAFGVPLSDGCALELSPPSFLLSGVLDALAAAAFLPLPRPPFWPPQFLPPLLLRALVLWPPRVLSGALSACAVFLASFFCLEPEFCYFQACSGALDCSECPPPCLGYAPMGKSLDCFPGKPCARQARHMSFPLASLLVCCGWILWNLTAR